MDWKRDNAAEEVKKVAAGPAAAALESLSFPRENASICRRVQSASSSSVMMAWPLATNFGERAPR